MNSSNRSRNPMKRFHGTNSSKSESKQVVSKPDKEKMKKTKQRSSSVNKGEKLHESSQKSQSLDRSISNRYNSQSISVKKKQTDNKKSDISIRKNTFSTNSKTPSDTKSKDSKVHTTSKVIKSSEKLSRLPKKNLSGKTNVEIARSFVQNVTGKKNIVESQSNSVKDFERQHSKSERIERPKTSTIHKDVTKKYDNIIETSEKSMEVEKGLKNLELLEKDFTSQSVDEDDDRQSYEEDFEDYDSDFDDSDSDSSVSVASKSVSDDEEEIINQNLKSAEYEMNTESILKNSVNFSGSEKTTKQQEDKQEDVKIKKEKSFLRMSDRSFLTNKTLPETSTEKKILKPSHSFINFALAVEQEKKKKYSNRVLKRASDLLEIINLNEVTYSHIDIPPMKYDTYIRSFGKTDAKQVLVQTENMEDEEIQTDHIGMINKWTQNPSYDNFGFGDDTSTYIVKEDAAVKSLFHSQNTKLSSFMQNCSKVMLTILKEDYSVCTPVRATTKRNELFYSDGYYLLPSLDFLKDIPVLNVYSCYECNDYILTIFNGIVKVPQINNERGVICIWNILDSQKPEHVLIAHSQPTCATFGPSGNNIVIAGMVDGSTLLWDLSDIAPGCVDESLSIKVPTYSTAVVLGKENHHSHIVAVQSSFNYSKLESKTMNFTIQDDSRSFHVLTLEDTGVLNVWVVIEVLKPDFSGLETDLGLSPGGKLRLVRSSTILLYDICALQEIQKINIRTFDFRLVPNDSNRILVTTDIGIILNINRQGGSANPRFYSSNLEFSSEVRCIDCSPHNEDLFLVGCSDGSAKLYNSKLVRPVLVFPLVAKGDPLTLIQWSPIHPATFVVLSSSSNFYLWNLMEDSHHPINSYYFTDSKVTWFSFSNNCVPLQSQNLAEKYMHMFISRDDGRTEVHIFKHGVSEKEYSKQLKYIRSL